MERIDQQILGLLSNDGRMSYTDIGRETGLSTSAAQQRVRRLEQRGIIDGYKARVNLAAMGRNLTAFISVRALDPSRDEHIPERVGSMDEVVSCFSVAGSSSYLLEVHVGTPAELDALLTKVRSEASVTTETTVVLTTLFKDRPVVDCSE